jgi:hypothetical protein
MNLIGVSGTVWTDDCGAPNEWVQAANHGRDANSASGVSQKSDSRDLRVGCLSGTGYPSGTIYPLLVRLERVGWIRSRWEECNPSTEGRPRRRYYKLSGKGLEVARALRSAVGPATTAVSQIKPYDNLHRHGPEECEGLTFTRWPGPRGLADPKGKVRPGTTSGCCLLGPGCRYTTSSFRGPED